MVLELGTRAALVRLHYLLDFDASSSETFRVSGKEPNDDLESIVVYSSDLDLSFKRLVTLKWQRRRIRARNFDERVMPERVVQIWNVQKCLNEAIFNPLEVVRFDVESKNAVGISDRVPNVFEPASFFGICRRRILHSNII